jgi:hypothetical protein
MSAHHHMLGICRDVHARYRSPIASCTVTTSVGTSIGSVHGVHRSTTVTIRTPRAKSVTTIMQGKVTIMLFRNCILVDMSTLSSH